MLRTQDDRARTFARAERAIRRRHAEGRAFGSVAQALTWYWQTWERLHVPKTFLPATEVVPGTGGQHQVYVEVDGGRGGDLDGALATLASIGSVLTDLREEDPDAGDAVEYRYRAGASLAEMVTIRVHNELSQWSRTNAATYVGRGEAYLAGSLKARGLVR